MLETAAGEPSSAQGMGSRQAIHQWCLPIGPWLPEVTGLPEPFQSVKQAGDPEPFLADPSEAGRVSVTTLHRGQSCCNQHPEAAVGGEVWKEGNSRLKAVKSGWSH